MSFENEFLELMPDTVILTAPTGHNAQGLPTYAGGTPKSYRARIVGDIMALRIKTRFVDSKVFIIYVAAGADDIGVEHQLQLPADAMYEQSSSSPLIYSVGRFNDGSGAHHVKLTCGFAFHHQSQL